MKDTKFRAWDANECRMVKPEEIIIRGDGVIFDRETETEYGVELTLLQYTGLKDKNGKEIYQGDIINANERGIFASNIVVDWNERFASFCLNKKGWAFPHFFQEAMFPEDCEVIGNIYENAAVKP